VSGCIFICSENSNPKCEAIEVHIDGAIIFICVVCKEYAEISYFDFDLKIILYGFIN
jgi:hypothetical protein